MPTILLLHTNRAYANSLARAVEALDAGYEVDVVSREPLSTRIASVLDPRYDLVQADELMVNGVLAFGGSVLPGTPFVVAIRGWADYTNAHDEYGRFREASIRLRTRAVLRRARCVIFLSERTRTEFESLYRVSESAVIGRPIEVEQYGSGTADADAGFDVLSVTNLRYEKKFEGVKVILQGLVDLFDEYDDLRYTVAGDGAYRPTLERFLDDYPYAERVDVLGFRDDVPDLLANADAFVYVSFLDAYPTVVLEAQAAGLPIVGGDAVGVPETVGDAGVVCPPTPDGVRDALERVIADDAYRASLAARSEEKMATYNERSARRHVEVWDRALGRSTYS